MIATLKAETKTVARKNQHGGQRPGAGRPKSESDTASAKIDRGILARAHFVARRRGITLTDYLASVLKPTVDRDFAKEVEADAKSEQAPESS